MSSIIVDNPVGMFPRIAQEQLKPNAATFAMNMRVGDGHMVPYRSPKVVAEATSAANASVAGSVNIRSIYRIRDEFRDTWLAWPTDVDVVRGQIANDVHKRIYYTGDGAPKVTDNTLARPGGANDTPPYPKQSLPLGVPEPTTSLRITSIDLKAHRARVNYIEAENGVAQFRALAPLPFEFASGDFIIIRETGHSLGNQASFGRVEITGVNEFRIRRDDGTNVNQADLDTVEGGIVFALDEPKQGDTYYAYSYVSVYGERGPLHLLDVPTTHRFHGTVELRVRASPAIPIHVNRIQIWRTINDGDASDSFYLVGEWNIPNDLYFRPSYTQSDVDVQVFGSDWVMIDDNRDSDLVNAEVAGNILFDPPSPESHSIIALTNGVTAMAVDNIVQLSVPGLPHAYPPNWYVPLPEDIVGLSYVGTTIIAITRVDAYLIHAADPAQAINSVELLYAGNGGVSKRSIVTVPGYGCLYASNVGLHLAGLNGVENVTRAFIEAHDWQEMKPHTLEGEFWENKYIGWFDQTAPLPGLIFDFSRADEVGLMWVGERLRGLYVDPETDELYGMDGRNVMEWDAGEQRLIGQWQSKLFDLDDDAVLRWQKLKP